MANNSTNTTIQLSTVPSEVLLFSVVFKFIAMIVGILGNITVIVYTIVLNKEKTSTSYLVGNLALADLLVCLTYYPIWIIELIQTILNIDSDQDQFWGEVGKIMGVKKGLEECGEGGEGENTSVILWCKLLKKWSSP
jgi:hypothetical protein